MYFCTQSSRWPFTKYHSSKRPRLGSKHNWRIFIFQILSRKVLKKSLNWPSRLLSAQLTNNSRFSTTTMTTPLSPLMTELLLQLLLNKRLTNLGKRFDRTSARQQLTNVSSKAMGFIHRKNSFPPLRCWMFLCDAVEPLQAFSLFLSFFFNLIPPANLFFGGSFVCAVRLFVQRTNTSENPAADSTTC